jgi:hypothetical protein
MKNLAMEYKTIDGRNVCNNGEVIINHVRHIVRNGWIKCDQSLNGSSWNTTEELSICSKCFSKPIQLELFI